MIICISGLTGSGKNTVGQLVAEKLGLRLVSPTFKTLAAKHKMSLMEFHKKAEKEHSIDKNFDAQLVEQTKKGNCVVSTWLGPWVVKNASLRVWLYATRKARAERIAKRDNMGIEEAERHVAERDESNHLRYREIYGIDIYDHSGFDLLLNSERFTPEQSSDIIAAAARQLSSKKSLGFGGRKKGKSGRISKR
ncbi:MAG: cytidylate kinase family protein [Candidatus Micrarchaeota archaeon]|nr:cytidylate kinase family protein [Candidatus Micrarchaeota archaeon]